ncbi:aldo/keto reductase [Faecalibacillus faecis]|uniref:aldo/keto reductase n=1 Tax=Faecalibacillus faecis TaxID=1982628 RepID=UPI0018ABF77C|nr:aldo/keto reductase [Faecalibacillus faecis]
MDKKLGFGLMRLPLKDLKDHKSIDMDELKEMVDIYLEKGFSYFDTGYPYHEGMSEVSFRETVVKRYPRDKYTITDKMPLMIITEASQYPLIFEEQLERCGVKYFDYYFLHAIGQGNYETVQDMKGFEFLSKMKKEGKIKCLGFSYHDNAKFLDKILNEHPETELVQLQINYIDWEDQGIEARKCYEVCCKHKVKVAVMEPLKGGVLVDLPKSAEKLLTDYHSNTSIASWGIRFAASLDNVIIVLSGMSNLEQMKDNLQYMYDFKPLTKEEKKVLNQVVDIIKDDIAIPCTGCRYCVDGCPQHIAIPESFALYNDIERNGKHGGSLVRYMNLIKSNGKAQDCISCRKCEEHCPQHIPIVDNLKKVAELFSFLGK